MELPFGKVESPHVVPPDAVGEWLDSPDVSAITKRTYRSGVRAFELFVAEQGLDLDELKESDVIAFKASLLSKHSPDTVSTYLDGVRSFYRWAESDAFPDITTHVKGASVSRDFKKDVLSPEQARDMLAAANGETAAEKRNFAMLNLMLRTGLRDAKWCAPTWATSIRKRACASWTCTARGTRARTPSC